MAPCRDPRCLSFYHQHPDPSPVQRVVFGLPAHDLVLWPALMSRRLLQAGNRDGAGHALLAALRATERSDRGDPALDALVEDLIDPAWVVLDQAA